MQITVHLDTDQKTDLAALQALIGALGVPVPYVTSPPDLSPSDVLMELEKTRHGAKPINPAMYELATMIGTPVPFEIPGAEDEDDGPTQAAADAPAVDSEGIPWDERIHSGSKALVADGTWRKRRGVDEITYGQIHAELQGKATGTEPIGAATPVGNIAPAPPAPLEPVVGAAPPPPTQPAVEETAPTAVAPIPAASASAAGNFSTWAEAVQAISKFNLAYDKLNAVAQMVGVEKFAALGQRPDLWATFYSLAEGEKPKP